MIPLGFNFTRKSLLFSAKTFLGAVICWFGLTYFNIANPIWAVITVIIVSDADITSTATLAKARVINTAVGGFAGIIALLIYGYTPWLCLLTAAITVLIITSLEFYPANWRLAPVTVIIIMDASRTAHGKEDEILYALTRAGEIALGCLVALLLAIAFNKLAEKTRLPL